MAEPVRLRIQRGICRVIAEISPDGGYHYNLRPTEEIPCRVFRGRVVFGDDDPLPMVSLLQAPIQPDQVPSKGANPSRTGPWELLLQGFVDDDFDNPTDPAEYLLADVQSRLAKEKLKLYDDESTMFGVKGVHDIHIGVGVVRPPDEISAKAYFWLPITLDVASDLSKPYQ